MADRHNTDQIINDPNWLRVGTTDAAELRMLLAGTVTIDLPSISANSIATATATVRGMTTNHRVLILPQAWAASEPVWIAGAAGGADLVQVTGYNSSGAAVNPTSQTCQFFSWRNGR